MDVGTPVINAQMFRRGTQDEYHCREPNATIQ